MRATITTTEGAVLGLLAQGERSGYELAKLAERSVAYLWTPSRSQIYKVLPRLVAAGFARVRDVEQHGRPDKALHSITTEGREELRDWLDHVDEEPAGGQVVFALKLFFCAEASPTTALAHLAAYRRFLEQRLAERLKARSRSPAIPTMCCATGSRVSAPRSPGSTRRPPPSSRVWTSPRSPQGRRAAQADEAARLRLYRATAVEQFVRVHLTLP